MTDRYRCGPENWNWNWQDDKWSIDISAIPTQIEHKLIEIWSIDMGAAPKTQTQTDRTIND